MGTLARAKFVAKLTRSGSDLAPRSATTEVSPRRGFALLACLCAILLVGLNSSNATAQSFRDGFSAYNVGDYRAAHSIWLELAKRGDANSQSSLGYLYYQGYGVRRDSRAAAKWYYSAASQGEPTAQFFLCDMHMRGDGVRSDLELALMWCELSIEGGESKGLTVRERLLEQMTVEQRDAAWALVAKWKRVLGGVGLRTLSRPSW